MICPFCDFENIEGVDQCERCQADLAHLQGGENLCYIEHDLLHRPLGELAVRDYLEVTPETSVADTVRRMNEGGHHCALIVSDKRLAGIFTERDVLIKLAGCGELPSDRPISDLMVEQPTTLSRTDTVALALNRMMVRGYRHIPVVDGDGNLAGVVSVRDILRYLVERHGRDLNVASAGS